MVILAEQNSLINFNFACLLFLITLVLLTVYTGNRYMEHWVHLCWAFNWEASFPWEERCPSARHHDWSVGNSISRSHCQGLFAIKHHLVWLWWFYVQCCSVLLLGLCNFFFFFFTEVLILHCQVRNEKARRYLSSMRKKKPIPFSQKFPNANPLALRLLERMLAFEPKDRPTAEEVIISGSFSTSLLIYPSSNRCPVVSSFIVLGPCRSIF